MKLKYGIQLNTAIAVNNVKLCGKIHRCFAAHNKLVSKQQITSIRSDLWTRLTAQMNAQISDVIINSFYILELKKFSNTKNSA